MLCHKFNVMPQIQCYATNSILWYVMPQFKYNYTGCTQCATPKLPKKVLDIATLGTLPQKNRDEIFDEKGLFCLFEKQG